MAARSRHRVLVVGAGGFLGKTLAERLAKSGGSLLLAARKRTHAPAGAKVICGDLEDIGFCRRILKNIDTVYYTAAFKKNIAVHTGAPFDAIAGNVASLVTFLRAAKSSKIRKLIYVSSTIVEYVSLEDTSIDGYVWGKYIGEMIVKAFAKETGIDVKIARSAPLYGAGDNFDPKTANFIPAFIRRVAEADTEVVIWGSGTRILQFIYVDDLARNLIAAAKSSSKFFVFGNPERISVQGIAKKIMRLSGRDLTIRHDLLKPDKETQCATFKNLISPKVDMEEGLQKTLQYYRTHHV